MGSPQVTIVVPSFNQGRFLDDALASIFQQEVTIEVFVLDGGSSDNTLEVIHKWQNKITWWRSCADKGQAAAINEGVAKGVAPYVCWLNSDDWLLADCLVKLIKQLDNYPEAPAVYGRSWNFVQTSERWRPVWVEPFNERRLTMRCIISQPGTLIRRSAWEAVGGVDEKLHMVMDYDLWWRLYKQIGPLKFFDDFVAVNREHKDTKTKTMRSRHYKEAMMIVRKYNNGRIPLKWWLAQPYAVWFKSIFG